MHSFKYIEINPGCDFGIIDIIGSILDIEKTSDMLYVFNNWMNFKDQLQRQFNVTTDTGAKMLTLPIQEVWNMRTDFNEEYQSFMMGGLVRLEQCHRHMMNAMNFARKWLGKDYATKSENPFE